MRTAREFARARRHSRLVRVLKIGLPVAAALIVAFGVAVTWLARSLPDNVSVADTSISDGRVVMQAPRMSGLDSSNRPYDLVAERAIQSLNGGGVDLEKVKATVSVDDDTTADITAESGNYDQTNQRLQLRDGITVETTSGISINLAAADIDLGEGTLEGEGPVAIDTPAQTIRSDTLTVSEGGKVLSFGGRVKMVLNPGQSSGSQEQASRNE
ncbi:LPS export ABC transporter periplasmic protein LptC [Aurantimonas sp. C2-6-R+9]|uniref:LPS export ABC transporter periplasmic protein LptC n=1 Tax=unclassified Aurantimonas TaxID=2638230 RepID=UPI002E17881A|nr:MULTISPECIES: LPS export ABC transporter periplasmic protein LptC [unclassified Aurantimonas]MEC5289536.1 LPS export ABC transporter periplasmic protein LptC [Aurantimonas sp. C2-3-R2]MEC5379501.1 LPS export ABC transporter periplasmic protein LptC [Aurantimonas sp. C2-6-R+9]MEC5410617.1 LPS export ABC transporter periplasmic protein LptC [Aurantimonas sp. C2-4-R8]